MKIRLVFWGSLCGFLTLAASASLSAQQAEPANSADNSGVLEEVVVTAMRREQSIEDIPAAISVVSDSLLRESVAMESQDIAQLVPSVQWETTSLSNPRIFIRGIGSLEFNANGSGSVGVYVDEVYIGSPSALTFQLLDLERVEVLRGPQGTLYGRNNTAGAINYLSKAPTDELDGFITGRIGNESLLAGEGALSGNLGVDGLSGRIAFKYTNRDGVNENIADPSDQWGDIDQQALRLGLAFDRGGKFNASFNLTTGSADQSSISYQALGVLDPVTGERCSDERILTGTCVNGAGLSDADPGDIRRAAYNANPHYDKTDTTLASLRLNWDLGFATLSSITGYLSTDRDEFQDTDATPITFLHANYSNESDQWTQEFRLVSEAGDSFDWVAGLYYFDDELDVSNLYETPAFPGGFATQDYFQDTTAWAAYGRGDFHINDRLTTTVGLRYTDEEKDFRTMNGFAATGVIMDVARNPSDTSWSGDLILDYELNDNTRTYGSYSRGFKAGGINGGVVFNPDQVTAYDPEYVNAFEVGLKFRNDAGNTSMNASVFFYDYEDLQLQVTRDFGSGVPTPVVDNAGAAEILGLELEGAWQATDALELRAFATVLDTEFTEYVDFGGADYTGNRLPSAPKFSFGLIGSYYVSLTDGLDLLLSADGNYRTQSYFTPENSILTERDESWLVNARAVIQSKSGTWSAGLWARNLLDEDIRVGYANLDAFGYKLHSYQDPRTYGLEVTVRFE